MDGRRRLAHRDDLRSGGRYDSPTGRILEAAIAIADADSEDDAAWHRGWMRLRKTLVELGWKPPPSKTHHGTHHGPQEHDARHPDSA